MNKTNIVLIGFSGSGKSTVGKQLAHKLKYTFIDTDRYFEEKYRFSIFDFFEQIGEEMFRKLESELLTEILTYQRCVIATGGGTPCFFDNMEKIKKNAFSIYIKLTPLSLFHRLLYSKKRRPLTKNLTQEELYQYILRELENREPHYLKADLIVKGENIHINSILQHIML